MKSPEIAFPSIFSGRSLSLAIVLVTFFLFLGCETELNSDQSDAARDEYLAAVSRSSNSTVIDKDPGGVECPECQLVDVIEVINADTLLTSIGEIQMYGAYVLDQPEDCSQKAEQRLRQFVKNGSDSIRIEPGPADTIRTDPNHYYLYTEGGIMIDRVLVSEGLALTWDQDGQHLGWLIYHDAIAKEHDSGCLWHDYQAFQRGEPNEFRIPGLTYRDS